MAKSAKKKPVKRSPGKQRKPKRIGGKPIVVPPPRSDAPLPPPAFDPDASVLDRLFGVVVARRTADPALSHSARLLSRGIGKVAQKFGEEAVECLIEAVAGDADAVIAESADVLYHLLVLWVASGVRPEMVWAELKRREGISGIAEKAGRTVPARSGPATTKIP